MPGGGGAAAGVAGGVMLSRAEIEAIAAAMAPKVVQELRALLEMSRALPEQQSQAVGTPLSGEKLLLLPLEERKKAVKARVEELKRLGVLPRRRTKAAKV